MLLMYPHCSVSTCGRRYSQARSIGICIDRNALLRGWDFMTASAQQSTDAMWLLSGQVDEGEPVREILITSFPFQVGRGSDVSFRIPSPAVSNLHAEIIERDGQLCSAIWEAPTARFLMANRFPMRHFFARET